MYISLEIRIKDGPKEERNEGRHVLHEMKLKV